MATILVKQHKKAVVLTILAVLSICAVIGYADHLVHDIVKGTWKNRDVNYEIGTGAHWWNNTDTYSHHYMVIENNSNTWVKLTYKWTHTFKYKTGDLTDQILIKKGDPDRRPKIRAGDTYSTRGYLNTHVSGGIDAGRYPLVSTTQVKFENGNGFSTANWITARYESKVIADD